MNKKISLIMAAILTLVSVLVPLMGGVDKEVKAAGGYIVPVTYSEEGYKVTGLEEPIDGEVDNRTIDITVEHPDSYTIYDFELTVINANKQVRKVYSSKLYLDEEINAVKSRYNLVIFKGDQVSVKSKKTSIDTSSLRNAAKVKTGCSVTTKDFLVNDGGFDQPANYYNERRTVYFENCEIQENAYNSFNMYPSPIEIVGYGIKIIKQPVTVLKVNNYRAEEVIDIKSESIFQPLEGNNGYTPKEFKSEFYIGKVKYLDVTAPINIIDSNAKKVKVKSIVPKTIAYSLSKNSTSGVIKSGKLEPTEEIIFEKLDGQQFRISVTGADDLNPDTQDPGTCDTTELENRIKQLEEQVKQLQSDLATKTTENQALTQEKAALQTKLDEALAELKKIEDEIAKAKNAGLVDGAAPDVDIKTLVDKINNMKTEVDGYKKQVAKLQAEIDRLKGRNKELEDLFDGLVVPEGPWTVPTEVPQGYTIKGLETPINNASETRTIEIVSATDKGLTVDNFDIVITNPLKAPRTVYSSIVWLGAGHIEGKNDKQLLNSTKYNLTVNKGDRIELRVKSEPYTIDKKSESKETKTTENNPSKQILVREGYYIGGEVDQECVREMRKACYEHCNETITDPKNNERCRRSCGGRGYGNACKRGQTWVPPEYRYESNGSYTLTTTTTTDTYTISDIDARVKAIEISGKDLGLKSNGTSKFEYTNSYVSKKVSSGKKDANGNAADINETPGMGTPNYKTNITNPGYSVESTAKEPKEIQVIKQPAGTVAEKFTIQPGETKDLAAYKDSDTKVESLSEPKAPSVADQLINLKKQVEDLEKKLAECEGKCSSSTELDKCNEDKAALEKEVETIREKIVKVIDGVKADNITDAANALLKKVADLEAKIKDLEAKLAAKEKELQDEKNKNAQLQKQITDLNSKIEKANKEIEQLNKEKTAAEEKIKNLNGQIEDLTEETKNLKKQLDDQKTGSDQKAKELEDKIKAKDAEIAKLKEDLANEKDNNKRMSEELARLKGILDKLNKNLSDAQDKFDEYNKIIEDNNKKIKELDEQIADNKQKQEDIKKQISDENAKPNPDQSVIDDLTKKLADTEAEGDKLGKEKEELEKSSKEAKDKIDQLERDIQAILDGDYEKLKEALEQAKKDFKDLKKSLDKAKKENENLRAELEKEKGITQEKDKKIQDLENEKSNTNDKVKEIQDKMSNLEKELKDKMDELDKINKQLNENEKARKDLEEKLKEELSKPESEQDPEVIKDLKSKLEDNKSERDDLLARKQKLIDEINELLKKKESLEKAIESALNGECGSCTDKPNGGKDDNNSPFNPWSNKDLYDWNKGYYGDSSSKGDKGKSGALKYVNSGKDNKIDNTNKSPEKDTTKANTGILPPRTTGQPQLGNRESTGIADYMTVFKFDSHSYQNYINDKYISKVEMSDAIGSIKPFISNDRTMLPIRYVAEALGMEVNWDQATATATFTNKAGNNALNVGSVTINAKTLEMRNQYKTVIPVDSKPILINGRFYVSVTNIIKAFGGTHGTVEDGMRNTIEWDKNNSRVLIYKNSR